MKSILFRNLSIHRICRWSLTLHFFFFSFLIFLINSALVNAEEIPRRLSYQGILADSTGQPVTGQHSITFRLYTELNGGAAFWTETQAVSVDSNGRFSVVLGSSTPLDEDQFTGTTFIEIQIGGDPPMVPRQQLTSVAYALKSADAMPSGVIVMWSGTTDTIPPGWDLCEGSNGTPNLRNRFIFGSGENYAVGSTGGAATHTLTTNEIPAHTHVQNSHHHTQDGHRHRVLLRGSSNDKMNNSYMDEGEDSVDEVNIYTDYQAPAIHHNTAINQNTGGGAEHNNMPPYYVLAFIMKL